jgi:catechol 2,3-dioxygenase-like lactoylglutathione lyase family enzyme
VDSKKPVPVLAGYHHVKLPVRDLAASIRWYASVLGLVVAIEFVEEGVLCGVALRDPAGTLMLALRADPDRAAGLAGFDPIALAVPGLADLHAWAAHLDALGVAHSRVSKGHVGWLIGELTDPDGIEIRLYTLASHEQSGR